MSDMHVFVRVGGADERVNTWSWVRKREKARGVEVLSRRRAPLRDGVEFLGASATPSRRQTAQARI